MSSASSRNGSEFERGLLSALGFGAEDDISPETRRVAEGAANSIIAHFGSRPEGCRRGIGGQWVLSLNGVDRPIAVALRSNDLRHPRPQGLPRALGFSTHDAARLEFTHGMQDVAARFRAAAGAAGVFEELDEAVIRRLYREVNGVSIRWIERFIADDPPLVARFWVHVTVGAYLQVVARRASVTINDRSTLLAPDSVRVAPADASRIIATFSNGDRIVFRLHNADKAFRATGQIPLKYAVTAAPGSMGQEWLFDDGPDESSDPPGVGEPLSADSTLEALPLAASPSGSNRHAGKCFEMLVCQALQRKFEASSDAFTDSAQVRDRARLETLPEDTRDRVARAAATLARWAERKWVELALGPAARVVRLPDAAGESGDNADIRIEGAPGKSLGLSLKHNNDVLKNHRPWNLPSQCGLASDSPEHERWSNRLREVVMPTERILVYGRIDLLSREDRFALYRRVTEASRDSIHRWRSEGQSDVGPHLWRFLFGRNDTYVAIAWDRQLEIRHYPAPALPAMLTGIDTLGSQLLVQFSNGHATRWRVHTASSRHSGGQFPLKWDARATSAAEFSEMLPL